MHMQGQQQQLPDLELKKYGFKKEGKDWLKEKVKLSLVVVVVAAVETSILWLPYQAKESHGL